MLMHEIVERRRSVKAKIKYLDIYIEQLNKLPGEDKASKYNKALELKFRLLSKLQSHDTLIAEQNNSNIIELGGNTLSVDDALRLRSTVKCKLDTLDSIIQNGDHTVVDIFVLLEQRDKLFEEYLVLDTAIRKSDINESWGE